MWSNGLLARCRKVSAISEKTSAQVTRRSFASEARTAAPLAFALIGLLGGLSYPLYSIAGAYTNDWVEPENLNAAASQLVTLYGMGAVVGPFAVAGAMIVIGPSGFFWALIGLHAAIALFFAYRMFVWRAPLVKRPWSEVSLPARAFFVPATIIAFGVRRGRKLVNR